MVKFEHFVGEVAGDGGLSVLSEDAPGDHINEGSFAHAGVAHHNYFEKVVVLLLLLSIFTFHPF